MRNSCVSHNSFYYAKPPIIVMLLVSAVTVCSGCGTNRALQRGTTTLRSDTTSETSRQKHGLVLTYIKTFKNVMNRVVVVKSADGQRSLYSPHLAFVLYDGARIWQCRPNAHCTAATPKDKIKPVTKVIFDGYFHPLGGYSIGGHLAKFANTAPSRTVAGVMSECRQGSGYLDKSVTYTMCTAKVGGYMTYSEEGNESWRLVSKGTEIPDVLLNTPAGVWNGLLHVRVPALGPA
jgi:hypothetical protein